MWESIQYVTTGLTLVAFAVSAAAWIYKTSLETKERLIKSAPEDQRVDLVRQTLEFFDVNTDGLTKDQKFKLAIAQVHARSDRFKTSAIVICIVALILASVSAYAISRSQSDTASPPAPIASAPVAPASSPSTDKPKTVAPKLALSRWPLGGWEVTMSNANLTDLAIFDAMLVAKQSVGPDLGFALTASKAELSKASVTSLRLSLFDQTPVGVGNLQGLQRNPALGVFNDPNTNCKVEVTTVDIYGDKHKSHEAFNCSRLPFPRP